MLSKWHCYEYMKQVYMRTGTAPTLAEMSREFEGLPDGEIAEGMQEFAETIKQNTREGTPECID